eukprot:scaffold38986_cov21-Tisochrysis_lutea.AAC.1
MGTENSACLTSQPWFHLRLGQYGLLKALTPMQQRAKSVHIPKSMFAYVSVHARVQENYNIGTEGARALGNLLSSSTSLKGQAAVQITAQSAHANPVAGTHAGPAARDLSQSPDAAHLQKYPFSNKRGHCNNQCLMCPMYTGAAAGQESCRSGRCTSTCPWIGSKLNACVPQPGMMH